MKKTLLFMSMVCLAVNSKAQLTSTNLPIAIVTSSATINDSVQVQGTLKLIDNATGFNTPTDAPKFNGMVGLQLSWKYLLPEKSLSVETWSSPTVSLDTSLLNMPSENDWVLLSVYEDRSLVRFMLSTKTFQRMGRYAPRMKYCELILDNQYMGIYLLGEKIKRDSNRVDLAKLTNLDVSGINLTGGYIFTVDEGNNGWTSAYPPPFGTAAQIIKFQMEYPDASLIHPVQKAYIKSIVDSFELAMDASTFQDTLIGWRKYGGVNTMADVMIMNEVSKDLNGYRKNSFIYKDKGGKLKFGPIWGFNVAWKNTIDCNSSTDTGWVYNLGATCNTDTRLAPFWWSKVATDTAFMRELKCMYTNYRMPGNALDTVKLFAIIDSVGTYLNVTNAVIRNFAQWQIFGVPIVNEPTPMATNHAEEIANMKAFIKARLQWLDTKWIQTTGCPTPIGVQDIIQANNVSVYPNPAYNSLNIEINTASKKKTTIELFNLTGTKVISMNAHTNYTQVDISSLSPGMYFVRISHDGHSVVKKMMKR